MPRTRSKSVSPYLLCLSSVRVLQYVRQATWSMLGRAATYTQTNCSLPTLRDWPVCKHVAQTLRVYGSNRSWGTTQ